ncbi:MAG: kelch repeat-containing protein [Phycisphaerales bacterium]
MPNTTLRCLSTPAASTLCALFALCAPPAALATGTWTAVVQPASNPSAGGMVLLSDGSAFCLVDQNNDQVGDRWLRLVPDANGSYVNGTWSSTAPMINTRLYFSSQVLRDGRLYVAGGEYGSGLAAGEVYNPLTNTWTATPSPGGNVSDANSEILPDGRVLQALVTGNLRQTKIYDPATNTFSNGPTCLGIHNESTWIKLPDNSILFVDRLSTNSERYIPASNSWVADGTVPVSLYDPFGLETGGAVRLPDGRAFFIGSPNTCAFYTPSGTVAPGVWTAGPAMPAGLGQPDAPVAMMVNGKVLCAMSPQPTSGQHFPAPTTFWEFNPATNAFTSLPAPGGGASINESCFVFCFLCLPNGGVLCSMQGSSTFWVYTPDGQPVQQGAPAITGILSTGARQFLVTGTGFNGISQGANYGDDWQMNTNYPVIRLTNSTTGQVYYGRTSNWNLTGVATGATLTSTTLTVPASVPNGAYSMVVTANGIASQPAALGVSAASCPEDLNANGVVDGTDLGLLLANWALPGLGDLNNDGAVDGTDLGLLLSGWGPC